MKLNWFIAALPTVLALSCTSLNQTGLRDPASVAEACNASGETVDLTSLPSQVLFKLQSRETSARGAERLAIYDQEFQRLDQMIKQSKVYSTGLSEAPDPRLVIIQKALIAGGDRNLWAERLYTRDPSQRPNPTDDQVQAVAAALINKNKIEQARLMLATISTKTSAPLEIRLSARLDLMRSYRYQGSDDEFLRQLEANRQWFTETFYSQNPRTPKAVAAYSSFLQALIRGHEKKEKFDDAAAEIGELKLFLSREHASPASADWMMGRLDELLGKSADALAAYRATLADLPSDDITKDQTLWEIGWMNYKLRHDQDAIAAWSQLSTQVPAQVLARNAFWIARAQAAGGDSRRATASYRKLIEAYPGTYYAPLAQRELHENIRPLERIANPCEQAARVISLMQRKYSREEVAGFVMLYRQKDFSRTQQFLMDLALVHGVDSTLSLAAAIAGDYQPLTINMQKIPLSEQNWIFKNFAELLFPNPFPTIINEQAGKQDVDPFLILSLIRQESIFAPLSLSYADARGLMQVMPQLGDEYVASHATIAGYEKHRLYEPAINVEIGTFDLKRSYLRNDGSVVRTLAAYNAGDEIQAVWHRHLSQDALEWVEEIPFQETNGYVKAIVRNEIYNRALYGDRKPFAFPEFLLKR